MDIKDRHDLYDKLKERFGVKAQIIQTFEEFAECQKELSKWIRGKANTESIAEEIADVEIMIEQIKFFFGLDDLVEYFKEEKLRRTKHRYGIQEETPK